MRRAQRAADMGFPPDLHATSVRKDNVKGLYSSRDFLYFP